MKGPGSLPEASPPLPPRSCKASRAKVPRPQCQVRLWEAQLPSGSSRVCRQEASFPVPIGGCWGSWCPSSLQSPSFRQEDDKRQYQPRSLVIACGGFCAGQVPGKILICFLQITYISSPSKTTSRESKGCYHPAWGCPLPFPTPSPAGTNSAPATEWPKPPCIPWAASLSCPLLGAFCGCCGTGVIFSPQSPVHSSSINASTN